jgi:hypothetical protein
MLPSLRSSLFFLITLILFTTLLLTPALAQYSSGFEATVTDPSGAAIPGATLTAINQDTRVFPMRRDTYTCATCLWEITALR